MSTERADQVSSNDEHTQSQTEDNPFAVGQFKDEIGRLRHEAIKMARHLEDLNRKAEFSLRGNVLLKSYDENPAVTRRRGPRKGGELPEKVFVMQNSVLTDLFESKHMLTIQHAITGIVAFWMMAAAIYDFYERQSIRDIFPSFGLVERSLVGFHIGFITWLELWVLTLFVYPSTWLWAYMRPNCPNFTPFDRLFLYGYLAYQCIFFFIPYEILFANPILGLGSAIGLTMEQVRLMMKMHSFVREVSKRRLRAQEEKTSDEKEKPWKFPKFKRFCYFLVAPTLIYRDFYPRNPSRRWGFIISNFVQFVASIVYMYYIVDRYLIPELQVFNPKTITFEIFIKAWIRCAIPGLATNLLSFFGFFHSWLNVWAELLRFGDRVFYRDWWTCTNYGSYWRQWNCVVHDWLHTYVYKELHDSLGLGKFKVLCAFIVFFVSSAFHEYILTAMLGFFFPLMTFYLSGVGFFVTLFKMNSAGRLWNTFFWWCTCMFLGFLFCLYAFETSARGICPRVYDNFFLDGFHARFLLCWGRQDL